MLGESSAIITIAHTVHQNPLIHPVPPAVPYNVEDGVNPASGHSHDNDMEDPFSEENLNDEEVKTKTYRSRVWILFVFSVIAWFEVSINNN